MYGRRPLTKLEAALYASIIGVLVAAFAVRALDYMELAERAAVQVTLTNLATGVNTRALHDFLRDAPRPDWTGGNAFALGSAGAPNYIGEAQSADLASISRGVWFYDAMRGEIVYVPRLRFRLSSEDPDRVLRFRLVRKPPTPGYMLVPTYTYRWE